MNKLFIFFWFLFWLVFYVLFEPAFAASPSEIRMIVPIATTHFGGATNEKNNQNYGLGIELKDKYKTYTYIYLDRNSFNEPSIYLSISYERRFKYNFYWSAGLSVASGYDELTEDGLIVAPVLSIRYKAFRLATTYPSAAYLCKHPDGCDDFVNLQYIHRF